MSYWGPSILRHKYAQEISRVWGRHTPSSSDRHKMKFGPMVDTCSFNLSRSLVCRFKVCSLWYRKFWVFFGSNYSIQYDTKQNVML